MKDQKPQTIDKIISDIFYIEDVYKDGKTVKLEAKQSLEALITEREQIMYAKGREDGVSDYRSSILEGCGCKDPDCGCGKGYINISGDELRELERLARIDELANLPLQAGWTFHGVKAWDLEKRIAELQHPTEEAA